jgi:hypothetical protein
MRGPRISVIRISDVCPAVAADANSPQKAGTPTDRTRGRKANKQKDLKPEKGLPAERLRARTTESRLTGKENQGPEEGLTKTERKPIE